MKANCQLSSYKETPSLFLFLLEQRGEIKHTNTHIIYIAKAKRTEQNKCKLCLQSAHANTQILAELKTLRALNKVKMWVERFQPSSSVSCRHQLNVTERSSLAPTNVPDSERVQLWRRERSTLYSSVAGYGAKKKKNEKKNEEGILLKSSDEFWCESITLRLC